MTQDATTVDEVARRGLVRIPAFDSFVAAWREGEFPLLSALPIRLRFALLVGLAVIGAVTFGAVYVGAERAIDSMLVDQDGYRRLNDLAGDVRAKGAALRNHEGEFLSRRDAAAADAFREDAAFVAAALDSMAALPQAAEIASSVITLKDGFAAAGASFDRLAGHARTLGLTDSSGLRGQLADSVKAVEDELKMWPNAGSLIPTMLQMRQAEKNFMLYGSQSYLGLHRKYANEFDFALDASPLPQSTRDDLRKLMKTYVDDMAAFADSTLAVKAEADALHQQFQALQPVLKQVFSYARGGMATAIVQQEELRARTSRITALVGLLAVLSFCAAALVLARSITQPVRLIEQAMNQLAHGNHAVVVPGIRRKDEIGDMAKAVEVFKDNAIAMVRLQQEQQAIRAEADAVSRKRMLAIADHFEQTVKSVADVINRSSIAIKETAQSMVAGEQGDGQSRSLAVAEAADKSRATVKAVADAAAELAASVDEISRHVGAASGVVREAVAELERADDRVRGLAEAAGRIDRVVNLIGDIAQRTNMLSLNATIEATRAGEAGKGFAVVAAEVKSLAQQTADSTQEIAQQIAAIQAATAETVGAIGDVGQAVRRMDEIAGRVNDAVARQAEAADRIGRCVGEVANDTGEVTEGVVAVTQSAARYCGAAVRVVWAADDLAGPASTLQREVDGFLRTIRG
ncbi:MAG: methyl-accepting chemotaxis protein [Pseudomonadota bacterium]